MKKIIVLLIALVFTLGVVGLSFSADVSGTVTKLEGKKMTVKDAAGKETTVDVKDAAGAKVGDKVTVTGGVVTKEAAAAPKKKKAIEGC
jgi:ABC-type Fe3+-hydroxamate transport system substrate-binding protein